MVSKKKARKVLKACLAIGEAAAAAKFGINVASVRRYCREAGGANGERMVYAGLIEGVDDWEWGVTASQQVQGLTFDEPTPYIPDVKPEWREDNADGSSRVLVVGDLHTPFDYEPYFNHCVSVYDKYDCDKVVFIGDCVDNHYSSYHETDADGMGGGEELERAISRLSRWYKTFPVADVLIGNHDRLVSRKAQTSSIPSKWIRDYKDVLETPNWNFTERIVYDGVQYIHGEGGTARTRAKKDLMSTVQGHLHTQCYTEWVIGSGLKIFAHQVGCGIDRDSYAMAYSRDYGRPAIACSVILSGKVAINEVMSINA